MYNIGINLYGGKMKRLFLYLTIVAMPLLFAGCKKTDTSDLKSIMTTEANGAMSPTTVASSESKAAKDNKKPTAEAKKSITEQSQSFSKDKSERMSIVYTGKSGDSNIIFTNNIDLESGKSIGLSDFADPLTLANYILSDDVVLENASNAQAAGFAEYKKTLSVDILKTLLEDADFPLIKENDINEGFPKVFSYEAGGDIFIAIPVSHELGDYVLVKYSPATK